MTIVIGKDKKSETMIAAVEKISGVSILECLQCKKCSNGCPVAGITSISPSEIINRLRLNTVDGILESDLVWMCVSCETCFTRCPMKIDMASVMDALRIISVRRNKSLRKVNVHHFNTSFLKTVKLFGRTYDLGILAAYKFGTSSYIQDVDKFPMMLMKRKIALFPSFGGDRKVIRRIFKAKEIKP